jgi:hypothetical protein
MKRQKSFLPVDQLDFTNEDVANGLLSPAFPLLWISLAEPWKRLQVRRSKDEEFRELSERESAWWLHCRIKRTAREMCERYPDFKCRVPKMGSGQFAISIDDKALVIFKKIRQNKFKNLDFWQQRRQEGLLDAPRYIVGYEAVKEMTEIIVRVCYPRSRGLGFRWTFPMPDQAIAVRGLLAENKVEAPSDGERRRGFIVKPRRMDSQEHGT